MPTFQITLELCGVQVVDPALTSDMIPSEAQLDQLEEIVTRYNAGALSVGEAAQQILEIGFTDGFAIGADSQETFESPAFQPYRELLDAVLRLQDSHRRT